MRRLPRPPRQWISLCICIQLFKVIKYRALGAHPQDGPHGYLRAACVVSLFLVFFGVVFVNSLIAFSMMLYVQLGPVMEDFYDNTKAPRSRSSARSSATSTSTRS